MLKQIPIFWKLSTASIIIIVLVLVGFDYVISLNKDPDTLSHSHWWTVLAIVIAIMLSCGAIWFLVNFFIKRPVRGLVTGMNELAEKRFDFRLEEDDQGEFGSLAASFNDMASMLSASLSELEKTKDYSRGILESSADIIITVFPSGKIRTFNTGAENALGYLRSEVIGKPIEMLFANQDVFCCWGQLILQPIGEGCPSKPRRRK